MINFNGSRKKLWAMTILAAVLFISATANAGVDPNGGYDPNDVRTTTDFRPPYPFGTAGDGAIFPGKPYIEREVVEVRITWDIVVAEGYDANDILANVHLPIITDSGPRAEITLNGQALGWSGSGTFNHYEVTDRYNFSFGPVWTSYDWVSYGLPYDAVEVLPTSRIEIDYLAPCNYILVGDLDNNCRVDFVDFAMMAANWLNDCITTPGDPACIPKE